MKIRVMIVFKRMVLSFFMIVFFVSVPLFALKSSPSGESGDFIKKLSDEMEVILARLNEEHEKIVKGKESYDFRAAVRDLEFFCEKIKKLNNQELNEEFVFKFFCGKFCFLKNKKNVFKSLKKMAEFGFLGDDLKYKSSVDFKCKSKDEILIGARWGRECQDQDPAFPYILALCKKYSEKVSAYSCSVQ